MREMNVFPRRSDICELIPAGSFLFLMTVYILSMPVEHLVIFTPDDAWFYPRIASNILLGHGISFDRLNPTSGFHWGWMLLLTGWLLPFKIFAGEMLLNSPFFLGKAAFLAEIAVVLAQVAVLRRLLVLTGVDRRIRPFALLTQSLLAVQYGMILETNWLLLWLFACIFILMQSRTTAALSFLCGIMLTVARIDFLAFAVGGPLLLTLSERLHLLKRGTSWSNRVSLLVGAGVGVGITAVLNYAAAGGFVSTSAALKGLESANDGGFFASFSKHHSSVLWGLLVAAFAAVSISFSLSRSLRRRQRLLRLLLLFIPVYALLALHLAVNALPGPWYSRPSEAFTLVLIWSAAGALVTRLRPLYRVRIPWLLLMGSGILLGILFIGLITAMRGYPPYSERLDVVKAAHGIRKHSSRDQIVFADDYSGILSFFSGRMVINGDGLVNSFAYIQDFLKTNRVSTFLNSQGVDYYVTTRLSRAQWHKMHEGDVIVDFVKPPFLKIEGSPIYLKKEDLISTHPEEANYPFFAIYRYRQGLPPAHSLDD